MSGDRTLPDSPRYRLDSRIATGGMGEVWRATDGVLGREVAVKLLKPEYADDPTFRSRFVTEARNAAALHHPNVASVFDFGELPATGDGSGIPQPYLVMELVRGEPLSALLRGGERMPPETAAGLLAQAADAIAAAHALGIVHRDVKPANLLVTPDGSVKITDFGIARAADAVALTQTGQVIGTPQYLSPEQAEGKPATPASDIYSLGVVLYECLAGRRPFDGDSAIATALSHLRDDPPALPDDVPEQLRQTVRVALAKDPAARFVSAADLATALRGGPVRSGAGTPAVASAEAPTMLAGPAAAPVGGAAVAAAAVDRDDHTRVLSAPPTRPPGPPPAQRNRRRMPGWLPWAGAALAVLLVVLVVSQLAAHRSDPTASGGPAASGPSTRATTPSTSRSASPSRSPSKSPTQASTSASPDQVEVNPDDYLGRPQDEAKKDLEDLGFTVQETTVDNPGTDLKDTVADVNPSGMVDHGSTITLSVYGDPVKAETPTPPAKSGDKGKGKGKK